MKSNASPISLVHRATWQLPARRKNESRSLEHRHCRRRLALQVWAGKFLCFRYHSGLTCAAIRFDRKLEGDPKLRGIKRKVQSIIHEFYHVILSLLQFEPNEGDMQSEKSRSLSLLSKLEREGAVSTSKKSRKDGEGGARDDVLNVRKAIRSVTKGKGPTAVSGKGGGKKGRSAARKGKR